MGNRVRFGRMGPGERFQSGGVRGIARFLTEHQDHDAGFDVRRGGGMGTGRLRITCRGCGESVEYRAAEAGELAAGPAISDEDGDMARPRKKRAAVAAPPTPAPTPEPGVAEPPKPPDSAATPRRRGPPRWLSAATIVVVVIGGLLLIAIGFIRDTGESPSTPKPTPSTPAPTSAPAVSAAPQPQQPAGIQSPAGGQGPPPALQRESFEGRFAIGVATNWSAGIEGSAVTITAPSSDAEIDIYLEAGDQPLGELADSASSFLRERHPDGKVATPIPVRFAHTDALQIPDHYPGGIEIALVFVTGGYKYLVLEREDSDISGSTARQASAELASFNPS
jgi:hypothetical protein